MLKKRKLLVIVVASLAMALSPALALSAPPPGKGGGGGGGKGGGGGGGGGDGPGIYAEMVLIDRDIDGVPILDWGLGPRDLWDWVPQPIMFGDKEDCPLVFADLDPVNSNSIYNVLGIEARFIPFVDGEIPEAYKACMTEAHLSRLNVARAPEFVSDRALYEMVTMLSMPGGEVGLDEAGRLQVSYQVELEGGNGVSETLTIDSPLQNLAGFERILERAALYHDEVNGGTAIVLPVRPNRQGDPTLELLDRAAALMGGAADKKSSFGLDELIYLTQILKIADEMQNGSQAMFGAPVAPGYFNFRQFEYNRAITYGGEICYLKISEPAGPPVAGDSLPIDVEGQIVRESLLPLVFPPLDNGNYIGGLTNQGTFTGFTGTNVWAFARAVDDARAVVQWVHDHPVGIELLEYCNLN